MEPGTFRVLCWCSESLRIIDRVGEVCTCRDSVIESDVWVVVCLLSTRYTQVSVGVCGYLWRRTDTTTLTHSHTRYADVEWKSGTILHGCNCVALILFTLCK